MDDLSVDENVTPQQGSSLDPPPGGAISKTSLASINRQKGKKSAYLSANPTPNLTPNLTPNPTPNQTPKPTPNITPNPGRTPETTRIASSTALMLEPKVSLQVDDVDAGNKCVAGEGYRCVEGKCVNDADGLPCHVMDQLICGKAVLKCERDSVQRGSRASRGDGSPKDDNQGVDGMNLMFALATREAGNKRDPDYELYLQKTLGKVLPALLFKAAQLKPRDGIYFIAQGLLKAADNQLYFRKRLDFHLDLQEKKRDGDTHLGIKILKKGFLQCRKDYTAALKAERVNLKWLLDNEDEIPEHFISLSHKSGRKKKRLPIVPLIGTGSRQATKAVSGFTSEVKFTFSLCEDSARQNAIFEIKRRLSELIVLEAMDLEERKEIRRTQSRRREFTIDLMAVKEMKERMLYHEIEFLLKNYNYSGHRDIELIKIKIEANRERMRPKITERQLTKEMISEVKESAGETEEQIERWIERTKMKRIRKAARREAKAELEDALSRGDFTLTDDGLIVYATEDWKHIGMKPPVLTSRLTLPVMAVDSPDRWAEDNFKCQVFLDQECYYDCDDPNATMFPLSHMEQKKLKEKVSQDKLQNKKRITKKSEMPVAKEEKIPTPPVHSDFGSSGSSGRSGHVVGHSGPHKVDNSSGASSKKTRRYLRGGDGKLLSRR